MVRPHEGTSWRWDEAIPPDLAKVKSGHMTSGILRGCSYCGSMHPSDAAAAITLGAEVEVADMKYGWPHKVYLIKVPNPFVGMLERRMGESGPEPPDDQKHLWRRVQDGFNRSTGEPHYEWLKWFEPKPSGPYTSQEKFYAQHLLDATPEEREMIERAAKMSWTFGEDGKIHWRRMP